MYQSRSRVWRNRCRGLLVLLVPLASWSSLVPTRSEAASKTITIGSLSGEISDCGTFVSIGQKLILFSGAGDREKTVMVLDGQQVAMSAVPNSSSRLPRFTVGGSGYVVDVKAIKNTTPADSEETFYYSGTLRVQNGSGSRSVTKKVTIAQGC
jgi:hypothetical protein